MAAARLQARRIAIDSPWPDVRIGLAFIGDPQGVGLTRAKATARRKHQSAGARNLAIELLQGMDLAVEEIPRGVEGEPLWPNGIVGSLSHTDGYAAASLARSGDCRGIGIDVEPALPLPGETGELVLGEQERDWVNSVEVRLPAAGRMIFCAKECVHKLVHPLTRTWLDFLDVRVVFEPDLIRFSVQPLSDAAIAAFADARVRGYCLQVEKHCLSVLRFD